MSEFDDRLRTAMHAVGDRAQVADVLDRSLHTSRVLRRRRAAAAITAAAVVVGGIGAGGWAIGTHSGRDGFSQVVTIPSSPAPSTPAPSAPAPSAPAPSSAAPSSSSPAPASSPAESAPVSPSAIVSATPTALTLVALPVVECPTQYGIANPTSVAVKPITEPSDVASSLANYTDKSHYTSVVGPRGWHCTALDAADGTQGLFIAPLGTSVTAPIAYKDLREGIAASSGGGAQMPYLLTCAAMPDLGVAGDLPCPKIPAGERFTRINHTTTNFIDPPGVAGIGEPSGGHYTALSQIRYSPPPIPSMGDDVAEITCTLPASDASLCQTIIDGFRPWVDPVGDPAAIQQCWGYYSSRNTAGPVIAGFTTTVGAANRYLDLVSGTPSQPPAVEQDAKHTSKKSAALCVLDGSYDVPGFVATRVYVIVGAGGVPLYPAVFNDQTSTPTRPAP